jgi:hypothetical protein
MSGRRRPPFWTKVQIRTPSECWPWQGYCKSSGHGLTSLNGRPIHASRKAWILTHGPIENGLCVNHLCNNAVCCNPDHLYLGTRAENMGDRFGTDGHTLVEKRRRARA